MDLTSIVQSLERRIIQLEDTCAQLTETVHELETRGTPAKQNTSPPPIAYISYDAFLLQLPTYISLEDIPEIIKLPTCYAVMHHIMERVFSRDRLSASGLWFPIYNPKRSRAIWIAKETDATESTNWTQATHADLVRLVHAMYIAAVDLLDSWHSTHTGATDTELYDIAVRKLLNISYGSPDPIFSKLRKELKHLINV